MVNTLRKEAWAPPPSPLPDGDLARRITGPRYDLDEVKKLLPSTRVWMATDNADDDLLGLEWDVDDVKSLIAALSSRDYWCSEWCYTRSRAVIDADVYVVPYDHEEQVRQSASARYYIKFGFRNNCLVLTVISCHLERP